MTSYDDPLVTRPVAVAPDADVVQAGRPSRLPMLDRLRERLPVHPRRLAAPGRGPSRWLMVWLVLGVVLAGIAGFGAWLGIGLLGASRDIKASAEAGQQQLQQFKDATTAGNKPLARNALAAADANLAHARARAHEPQVRVAGHLPFLSTPVNDLNHLLAAATIIASAGHTGLDLYTSLSGGGSSSIYANGQFDIPALRSLATSASTIDDQMGQAERELVQVKGNGIKENGVPEAKAKGLKQVRDLRKQVTGALPVLRLLPDAVGASGPKTYLVTVLNPSELRASGGAPLSVAELHLDQGRMSIPENRKGQTSDLTTINGVVNAPVAWKKVDGDPFWIPLRTDPTLSRFVNANANPDFRVAGPSMARAWTAQFGQPLDGVIALDTDAIAEVLRASGSIPAEGYGEVTADNLTQLLLQDAYAELANQRHTLNNALMSGFIARLQSGSALTANAKGLAASAPGRHLQLWFANSSLQQLITDKRYDGSLTAPAFGDHVAVFSQNGNSAKSDIYQQRAVDDKVALAADGSAVVTRTVTVTNTLATPSPIQVQAQTGYRSGWVSPAIISLMPKGSVVVTKPVTGTPDEQGVDQAGRPFYRSTVKVAPGASVTWVLVFKVPHFAKVDGSTMTFQLVGEPQPMANPETMHVDVAPPSGWHVVGAVGDGASAATGHAVVLTTLDRRRSTDVSLSSS